MPLTESNLRRRFPLKFALLHVPIATARPTDRFQSRCLSLSLFPSPPLALGVRSFLQGIELTTYDSAGCQRYTVGLLRTTQLQETRTSKRRAVCHRKHPVSCFSGPFAFQGFLKAFVVGKVASLGSKCRHTALRRPNEFSRGHRDGTSTLPTALASETLRVGLISTPSIRLKQSFNFRA